MVLVARFRMELEEMLAEGVVEVVAVDKRHFFKPKSRHFTVIGSEYRVPPLQAPVDAKLTHVRTSVISNSNLALTMSLPCRFSKSPNFPARSPICAT